MIKDITKIPRGIYCGKCSYLDTDENYDEQWNGYCHFLEQGDWDLDREGEITDGKTGKIIIEEERNELPFCFSLLWDGCKECCINMGDEDIELI